jgi:hypothetical protein
LPGVGNRDGSCLPITAVCRAPPDWREAPQTPLAVPRTQVKISSGNLTCQR